VVEDDGIGFDLARGADRPGSYGIRGMRERAAQMGAALEVQSAPGRGTTIVLDLESEP
jgi:signal transduction histidine kinase